MRRFLFLSMLVFIGVMIWGSVHEKEELPLIQKLERAMELTRMLEYKDKEDLSKVNNYLNRLKRE